MGSSWPPAVLTTPFACGISTSGRCLRILRHPLLRRSWLAFRPRAQRRAPARARPCWRAAGTSRRFVSGIIEQGQVVDVLRGHEREIECLAFSPDGTLLASGSHDGLILLWEMDGSGHGRLRARCGATAILSATWCFIPMVTCWRVGVRMARSASGMCAAARRGSCCPAVAVRSPGLAFDPDGRVLAGVSEDRAVRLWEVETGRALESLTGYMYAVLAVRFRPDGRQLASGSGDGRIHLWEQQPWPAGGRVPRACRTGDRAGVQPRWPAAGQRQHGRDDPAVGSGRRPSDPHAARASGCRQSAGVQPGWAAGWPAPASTARSAAGPCARAPPAVVEPPAQRAARA